MGFLGEVELSLRFLTIPRGFPFGSTKSYGSSSQTKFGDRLEYAPTPPPTEHPAKAWSQTAEQEPTRATMNLRYSPVGAVCFWSWYSFIGTRI